MKKWTEPRNSTEKSSDSRKLIPLSRRGAETGLGLAVCYSIANRHHAKIEVSTSRKGSVFTVCLPIPQDE
ncbi:ATP-binding protein [Brevibacillus fluminis]|uniref:ATP-binding protein n=1 Tax=Brevibacillus fluminis TaxID=511487 RepID=UPI003F8BEA0F